MVNCAKASKRIVPPIYCALKLNTGNFRRLFCPLG